MVVGAIPERFSRRVRIGNDSARNCSREKRSTKKRAIALKLLGSLKSSVSVPYRHRATWGFDDSDIRTLSLRATTSSSTAEDGRIGDAPVKPDPQSRCQPNELCRRNFEDRGQLFHRLIAAEPFSSESYPHAIFTAVIYRDNRPKFGAPETSLRGKQICVTGEISDYYAKPEIVLTDPSQLTQYGRALR
jgi:hypothetical protein